MTQPITTRGGWKARLGQIADAYPQAAGLLRRGTLARDLWSLSPHSPTFCRDVLALLQPALGVPPQKAQPWLLALYQHLADQRFPDEARGHPRRPFSPEEALYLALLDLALQHRPDPFDPLMDLLPLPPESLDHSPTAADYQRFLQAAQEEHILALFTLGRELMPFDPAAHTIGVHNVALHTAILARQAGLPVDLPLVRAAAFGHDLGKFGCRGAEAQRIPYLHYYYTWQWFREHGLESIGHISANHSTWDLECENLPMESLLLIYADFRVRGQRDENGREHMAIYTLDQARDLIFSKLADMTPAKQRRYETVYRKLRDFEHYLRAHGVPTDLEEDQLRPVTHTDPALLFPEGALERLRDLTFANSIHLMATVAASEPFAQLLERAKGAKNTQSIRTYLHLLEEYNTYMTASNRRKTLALLYELLMHPEGDVRRKAGQIDLVCLGAGLVLELLGRGGHNAQAKVSPEGVDGHGPAGVQEAFKQAAFQQKPFVEDVSQGEEDGQHKVLLHFQPAQHSAHADEQAGRGKLGKEEATDVHHLELPRQEALYQQVHRHGDAHGQEGGSEGSKLMAPEEHHEEAEAHQQHGQDVDGPGVGDGVKNGLGGTVQTAFVNGGDGAEPLCHVAVDRGEEGHCHGHRDEQKHDEQAGLALGLHGLYTSLLLKYHKGPGAGSGPLRENYCSTI